MGKAKILDGCEFRRQKLRAVGGTHKYLTLFFPVEIGRFKRKANELEAKQE